MLVSIGILAHNEASCIGNLIRDIGNQEILTRPRTSIEIHVVANGCTDATVTVSRDALGAEAFRRGNVTTLVHSLPIAGKSNAWNELIHNFASSGTEFAFLLDADVRVPESACLLRMLEAL